MKAINKAHELALISEDVRIEYDRDVMNGLYKFIDRYRIMDTIKSPRDRVLSFHKKFCIENEEFPQSIAYDEIYPKFTQYVRDLPKPPESYEELCDRLIDWNAKHCTNHKVEAGWREPPTPSYGSPDNYTDIELIHYYNLINVMYSPEKIKVLLGMKRTFIRKVYDEITKRGLLKNELSKHGL